MIKYGNVAGFVYSACQQEAPKPKEKPKPKCVIQEHKNSPTKKCTGCGEVLPLDYFKVNERAPGGHDRYCRACECRNEVYKMERAKRRERNAQ